MPRRCAPAAFRFRFAPAQRAGYAVAAYDQMGAAETLLGYAAAAVLLRRGQA